MQTGSANKPRNNRDHAVGAQVSRYSSGGQPPTMHYSTATNTFVLRSY